MLAVVVITGLGLTLGSFINAFVWRLHNQATATDKQKRADKLPTTTLKGRSMCPHCRHELAVKDLVPLLSWVWLRGKCRYCRKPISVQYPLVELGTALIFALSALISINAQPTLDAATVALLLLWLTSVVLLVALFTYDLKWLLLPSMLLYSLIGVSAVYWGIETFVVGQAAFGQALPDLLISQIITFGFFLAIYGVSHGRWLGFGDVLLAISIGFLFPPLKALLAIVMPFYLGTLFFLPGMLSQRIRLRQKIPFGPFIISSVFITYLFGAQILRALTALLGFPEVI